MYCELIVVGVVNNVCFVIVIVVDVKMGEILVMVLWLLYNLNDKNSLFNKDVMCNCGVVDFFELGLIMKFLIILMVLESGKYMLNIVVNIILGLM